MQVDLLTKEYPPEIYGGAGVHVAELTRALRASIAVTVRAFGADRSEPSVFSYRPSEKLATAHPVLQTLDVDLQMAQDCGNATVVHSHTWYANEAGRLAQSLYGIPHVITAHSLEPLRPWKAEQLGGGYALSSFVEFNSYMSADAVIAVSAGMRTDILRCYPDIDPEKVVVIHNGVDTQSWQPITDSEVLTRYGIDSAKPSVVFVGRMTRQKGLTYLVQAAAALPPDVQLVLCASAPDTPEIEAELRTAIEQLSEQRSGVMWIQEHLAHHDISAILSNATVFACPSIYEPLGIVNLEAMACGVPVVATATGGIPEVVVDGETGWLVPIEQVADGTGTPTNPEAFVADFAAALTEAVGDSARAQQFGAAGRRRAISDFSWSAIATQTLEVYSRVVR